MSEDERFIVEENEGCIAITDTKNPDYAGKYVFLDQRFAGVVLYQIGTQGEGKHHVSSYLRAEFHQKCRFLNEIYKEKSMIFKENDERYFVDVRMGCIAILDTEHPDFDPKEIGLEKDRGGVFKYKTGVDGEDGWKVPDDVVKRFDEECFMLNLMDDHVKKYIKGGA